MRQHCISLTAHTEGLCRFSLAQIVHVQLEYACTINVQYALNACYFLQLITKYDNGILKVVGFTMPLIVSVQPGVTFWGLYQWVGVQSSY